MARGTEAKKQVTNKLAEAFGDNYIGEHDKKIYVWANDGGEKVQIAISLTCPKTNIEIAVGLAEPSGDWDFTDDSSKAVPIAVSNAAPAEITEEEINNLQTMMERLGL